MRMVKVLAVLLVPLLLTSFLAVAPAAHASKTYKLEMWAVLTPDTSVLISYKVVGTHMYWIGNYTYDLYDGYPGEGADVTSGYLIGHKWIYCWGVQDLTTYAGPAMGFGVYTITGNSNDPNNFLGGKTGTFVLVYAGYTDAATLRLHGSFWISGGTGGLKGISGHGTFLPDDPINGITSPGWHPYPHYLGTVVLP